MQLTISSMPLAACCVAVLPEFGLRWRDVSRAVRNARLPMTPASVGSILTRHASRSLSADEVSHIMTKLKLKSIATQPRNWHAITLLSRTSDEPVNILMKNLPSLIKQALMNSRSGLNKVPKVQSVKQGDLIYISVQMLSDNTKGSVFYLATPPGQNVAFVSSLHSNVLRPCVYALGFTDFEDACLNGKDLKSLMRITNDNNNAAPLPKLLEYTVKPCVTSDGIDYTGRHVRASYTERVLGPNPPQLGKLAIKAQGPFVKPHILNKKITMKVELKSESVARSLHLWSVNGVVLPTSDLLRIFNEVKSNQIHIEADDSE